MGLPSLDVHLLRRGAILHLTLCGGACREEMQSAVVSGGGKAPTNNWDGMLSTLLAFSPVQPLHTLVSHSLSPFPGAPPSEASWVPKS